MLHYGDCISDCPPGFDSTWQRTCVALAATGSILVAASLCSISVACFPSMPGQWTYTWVSGSYGGYLPEIFGERGVEVRPSIMFLNASCLCLCPCLQSPFVRPPSRRGAATVAVGNDIWSFGGGPVPRKTVLSTMPCSCHHVLCLFSKLLVPFQHSFIQLGFRCREPWCACFQLRYSVH